MIFSIILTIRTGIPSFAQYMPNCLIVNTKVLEIIGVLCLDSEKNTLYCRLLAFINHLLAYLNGFTDD